jgi:hypothetical protein
MFIEGLITVIPVLFCQIIVNLPKVECGINIQI